MPNRFSLDQKINEIERELKFRRAVYRVLVKENRMSPQEASDRIAIMESILEDYRDQLEPRLGELT